jgi:hypothetical protein
VNNSQERKKTSLKKKKINKNNSDSASTRREWKNIYEIVNNSTGLRECEEELERFFANDVKRDISIV